MNISEAISWADFIYQISRADKVEGGTSGVANIQAKQLADRTQFLKMLIESMSDYREYTFYKSESDPDGTIAGLANTPSGKMFRVAQSFSDDLAFIYYLNDSGAATAVTSLLGRGAITNNVREYSTLDIAQNDVTAGNVLDGKKCRVTNPSDETLTDEYINNGGILEPTGRKIPTTTYVDRVESNVRQVWPFDFTGISGCYLDGYALNNDGTTTPNSAFRVYYIPVRQGDRVDYAGVFGSYNPGEVINYLQQLDANKSFVTELFSYTSNGSADVKSSCHAYAVQDGFIAVRARTSVAGVPFSYSVTRRELRVYADNIDVQELNSALRNGGVTDYSDAIGSYIPYIIMESDGSYNYLAGPDWRFYYIPVKAGDSVTLDGRFGSAASGEVMAYLFQLDTSRDFVSVLYSYVSNGNNSVSATASATATRDGYIGVRVRVAITTSGAALPYSVIKRPAYTLATDSELNDGIGFSGQLTAFTKSLIKSGGTRDITAATDVYVVGRVIYLDGTIRDGLGSVWRTYYIPVTAGDQVTYTGNYGSTTSGELMGYFYQLDYRKNIKSVLYQFTSTGTSTYYQTVTVTATQSGYIAVRVRNYGSFSVLATASVDNSSGYSPRTQPQMERLPVKMDTQWDYNGSPYIQDQIVTAGDYQYLAFWAEGGVPVVMQRSIYGGTWSVYDLSDVVGNPLHSPVAADGHNVLSMTVTSGGYIIVTGNYHNNPCRCVISDNPHDITAFSAIVYSSSNMITYPRFVTYPDGTTQAFWREGASGDGAYWSAIFNDDTKSFEAKINLIAPAATVTSNPYEQRPVVGADGVLHLCWGYRTNYASANSNFGMFYAKSTDKGVTWKNAAGSATYALPLSDANSEKIFDAPAGSGYCNQNGACVGATGNYHTVIWQYDTAGNTQICHIRWDGSSWQSALVSDFTFKIDLNVGILDGTLTRPVIATTRYGKTYVFYHTTKMGRQDTIRAIDVSTPGAPVDFVVCAFNVGTQSLSVNTDAIRRTGVFEHLLSRGAAGNSQSDYATFTAETAFLASVMLP